jgi:glutathione peroxidase
VGGAAGGAGGAGAAGTAGGQVPAGCEAPAKEGEFYALSAESLEQLDPIPMCAYRGKVVMVVNVASKCGYTPQYAPLQKLYDKYREQGFTVLGFPCAQFADQEFQDDKEISEFCTETYGITFPMFSRIDVNGPKQHPVYAWLKAQPGGAGDIPWNFTKFLIGRDGKLLKRIPTATNPDAPEVVKLIEEALAVAP